MVKFQQARPIQKEFSPNGAVLKGNKPAIQIHHDVTVSFEKNILHVLDNGRFEITPTDYTLSSTPVFRSGSKLQQTPNTMFMTYVIAYAVSSLPTITCLAGM